MPVTAINAESLSYSYGERAAIRELSFSIGEGCLFGLLGPNGSGKTTLFRLLSTLIPVQKGRLDICGHDVSTKQEEVRKQLGVTFQSPAVDVRLTVRENLSCHGRIYGLHGSVLRERLALMLERFGLADRASTLVGQLSGGLKRRVELAKGLMHSPRVLLLDEPTSGLDPRARQDFWDLVLNHIRGSGTTVVVATHLMSEAELCDQLLLLDQGQKVAEGSPVELQGRLAGERLTLRMRDAAAVQTAVEKAVNSSVIVSGNQLSVRVNDPATQITILLNQFRNEILGLELTRPSLDDVFLELTGRSLLVSGDAHA
ncbi:MAG: ATP-binding cassette domain-containing protein [Planctomycetales bacterium]|nr:ATP-binding cassette domain-containing protein [Planctomycetales bacterium]